MRYALKIGLLSALITSVTACQFTDNPQAKPSLKQQLAQKIVLDFRYYCQSDAELSPPKNRCVKPMTQLPSELAELIATTDLGGVILFSDNLENASQIVRLTHDLQQAGKKAPLKQPLFISVDQEGGRVARLPRQTSTAFPGSLAIAATYNAHGTYFATKTGEVIADELIATGFNLNFAPTVDVNVNPNNPVINVRSFGENPKLVSELAAAQLAAMQNKGMLGTLKHFPGHGDTSVDSHTGLPRVDHDFTQVEQIDLAPFQYAIDNNLAKVIMTAHIQYPELDKSTFVSKSGETMVKPATMSRAILTDLLRHKMNYQGLVITDALDMKGISQFFDKTQAVIETFKAGSDIALMPIAIRTKQDIKQFSELLNKLEQAVLSGELNADEVFASYQRISNAKQQIKPTGIEQKSFAEKLNNATKILANKQAKDIEDKVAEASLTAIKGSGKLSNRVQTLHMIMPDESKCQALTNALSNDKPKLKVSCSHFLSLNFALEKAKVKAADALLIGSVSPKQSLAEMGGMEDLPRLLKQLKARKYSKSDQDKGLRNVLKLAKQLQKETVFISLRMPYEAKSVLGLANHIVASYSYNQHQDKHGQQTGSVYRALSKLLTGKITATGQLPVSIN